jgi:hypothetical protein
VADALNQANHRAALVTAGIVAGACLQLPPEKGGPSAIFAASIPQWAKNELSGKKNPKKPIFI